MGWGRDIPRTHSHSFLGDTRLFVALSSSRFLEFEELSLGIVAGRGQCWDAGAVATDMVPFELTQPIMAEYLLIGR